jgi:hypothetical protein
MNCCNVASSMSHVTGKLESSRNANTADVVLGPQMPSMTFGL